LICRDQTEKRIEDFIMKKRFMLSAAGVSVAAIAGFAPADIVVVVDSVSLLGSSMVAYDLGAVSGTLTGIGYSYAWSNDTGDSSWSSDMLIGVSASGAMASVGGYNLNFGGSSWGGLNGSAGTGTYSGSASGSMAMNGAGAFYWANGWSSSAGTTSSGTFTLYGINAVPAPGALALLGLAGIASRRRRK
jgi:MYXO-CTERM domain-containing protein